jgi:hypothetical protein
MRGSGLLYGERKKLTGRRSLSRQPFLIPAGHHQLGPMIDEEAPYRTCIFCQQDVYYGDADQITASFLEEVCPSHPGRQKRDLVIIDNQSSPRDFDILKEIHPEAIIVEPGHHCLDGDRWCLLCEEVREATNQKCSRELLGN